MYSSWSSFSSAPPDNVYLVVDLGQVQPVGAVKWITGQDGLLGSMTIEYSTDQTDWQPVLDPGAGAPKVWTETGEPIDWREIAVNADARYIRFTFSNPDQLAQIGDLAEVQVHPPES